MKVDVPTRIGMQITNEHGDYARVRDTVRALEDLGNAHRNPHLQADMARTVDHISGGRFIFGTGSGWFARDFTEYGYPFGTAGSRLDALAADLPIIKERWKRLDPAPVRDIPVLIGGGGERKTLRIVAQHADIQHSLSGAATLRHKLHVLSEWCERVGRNPSDIEVGVTVTSPHSSSDHAELDDMHALGVRVFQGRATGPHDLDGVRRLLRWRETTT